MSARALRVVPRADFVDAGRHRADAGPRRRDRNSGRAATPQPRRHRSRSHRLRTVKPGDARSASAAGSMTRCRHGQGIRRSVARAPRTTARRSRQGVDEATADLAKGAVDAAKGTADALGKLGASRVVTGRERCAVAPNGAPDCRLAAEALCKAKGFNAGNSVDYETAESCPAQVLLSGRRSRPGECPVEHTVTKRDVPVKRQCAPATYSAACNLWLIGCRPRRDGAASASPCWRTAPCCAWSGRAAACRTASSR